MEKCNVCDGKGYVNKILDEHGWWWCGKGTICPKCKGYKELDWVEMVKGKNCEEPSESLWISKKGRGTLSSGPR